jgi:hypothetical protein
MKRALGLALLLFSLTGCAVRARYYSDPYWRGHDRDDYRHHQRRDRDDRHRDSDDRWR